MNETIYIAGPMRGYPKFNFPAFDEAEEKLKALGYKVLSPATMDRESGFSETTVPFDHDQLRECVKRDIEAICQSDMIIVLDGYENSIGATAECAVARWLDIPVIPISCINFDTTVEVGG